MGPNPLVLRTLLEDLKADEYVRFKFGKRIDSVLKALESQASLDIAEVEARLQALLDLVKTAKGGATAQPASKSRRAVRKGPESVAATAVPGPV